MNSIWNNNIALFCERFPALAAQYQLTPESSAPDVPPGVTVATAKNGAITAQENGKFWHSQYNPVREADQTARSTKKADTFACAFVSVGLGYTPIAYAGLFPTDTILIVEPEPQYFFAALTVLDWSPVFKAKQCIIALHAETDDVIRLIERAGGFSHCAVLANQNQTAHAADYVSALFTAIARAKQKNAVNTNTLERFSGLWMRNSCRNLQKLSELDGITRYMNQCPENLDAVVLAAGPTLDTVLPHLAAIKKRALVICVDTALRACLRVGVEPDFILLVDPQYYAARHIAGLSAPSSVLITESAAYPSVFHFSCKKIVLCGSLFPLGKYIERAIGSKGALQAGGSVSTSAWDFARVIGARRIFMAGLDLGYPDLQTHIRGATFEEKIHTISRRTRPAETTGIASLFGANMLIAKDYDGNPLLTDDKMKLFGWWFENKLPAYPAVTTFSFSSRSFAITSVRVASVEDFLAQPEKNAERAQFFSASEAAPYQPDSALFSRVYDACISGFDALYQTAKKGIALADKALADRTKIPLALSELEAIDAQILRSEHKDVAALVFPTERKLNDIFAAASLSADPTRAVFERSKIIYRELQKGINEYRKFLQIH